MGDRRIPRTANRQEADNCGIKRSSTRGTLASVTSQT